MHNQINQTILSKTCNIVGSPWKKNTYAVLPMYLQKIYVRNKGQHKAHEEDF